MLIHFTNRPVHKKYYRLILHFVIYSLRLFYVVYLLVYTLPSGKIKTTYKHQLTSAAARFTRGLNDLWRECRPPCFLLRQMHLTIIYMAFPSYKTHALQTGWTLRYSYIGGSKEIRGPGIIILPIRSVRLVMRMQAGRFVIVRCLIVRCLIIGRAVTSRLACVRACERQCVVCACASRARARFCHVRTWFM